ncbi:MAG: PKD domain-containing protein [Solirubrobacterales bacterium]|nr:PKD domain-containing protein [Solirubrobacterales bacterium]
MLGSSLAGLLAAIALAVLAAAAAAQPSPGSPFVIDGPSAAIDALGGLSVARDGTGGLVYLKTVGGAPHVFVSRLVSGQFQPAQQVDGVLPVGSSEPVIAAGNGGVLLVAFINNGGLYVADAAGSSASFGAPQGLAASASNPSIQMTNFGKAYLAFTVAEGSGSDVRAAYYVGGSWTLESAPLNATPADDAGTGSGRPAVAAAGDGVAIVAWGEGGHVYARRVWGTVPSVVDEQADPPAVGGCGEVSAGEPAVSSEGDSSYADVAFQEVVSCAGAQQTRVLVNRLRGSQYDGATAADTGSGNADEPQVAMTEYGAGLVTAAQEATGAVLAMELSGNGGYGTPQQINSIADSSAPYAVPAIAGLFSDFVAWQQDPGSVGPAEIRLRYEPRASSLGPEMVVSSPAAGPTDAARGLAAAGDVGGDAAAAWVQGTGSGSEIVVVQLYQPPGSVAPTKSLTYARTPEPALSWSAAAGRWGPVRYTVSVDGAQVAQTTSTSIRVPIALHDGPHSWQVTAVNPAGVTGGSGVARVFVDTVAPELTVAVGGVRQTGSRLRATLRYRDAPPVGLPPGDASGVTKLTIGWGDGTVLRLKPGVHHETHVYRRPGRYKITVTVTDRAGNSRTVVKFVRITKASGKTHG